MSSRLVSTIFRKSELDNAMLTDPVSKFRVSQPETLIDTDFEYGLQSTKWETIELINNIPIFFAREGDEPIPLIDVVTTANSDIVTVTTSGPCGFIVGSPFIVTGLKSVSAEGSYVVFKLDNVANNVFYYKAREIQEESISIYDAYSTTLYTGRVYQSTQYNIDSLVSMITNEEPNNGNGQGSTITVTTKYPHGFKNDTLFTLANSVGIRQINFDASLVDPLNSFQLSNIIAHTNSNNGFLSGFRSRNVVPFDYESKKTLSFIPEDINISTNQIYIPNHGQADSTESSNIYFYQAPIGDEPVGGLQHASYYALKKIDNNNIALSHVSPYYIPGLWNISYEIGLNTNTLSNTFNNILAGYTNLAIPTVNINTGGGGNLPKIWTGAVANINVAPNISEDANAIGIGTLVNFQTTVDVDNQAHVFFGYLKPEFPGVSNIELRCYDYAKLWFGNDAIWEDGYPKNPSMHITYADRGSLVGIATYTTPFLNRGQLYPFRIEAANDNDGQNTGTTLSMRMKENTKAWPAVGAASVGAGTPNFNRIFVAPLIGVGPKAGAPRRPMIIDQNTIDLTSRGTSNFGVHTLQKAYPVVGIHTTSITKVNLFTVHMNATNYTDATIINNSEVTISYPQFTSNLRAFTMNDVLAHRSHTTVVGITSAFGNSLKNSYSNVSKSDYVKYRTTGRPGSVLTVGLGSYTGTTDMTFTSISGPNSGQTVGVTTFTAYTPCLNVMGVSPVNNFVEYDSFYYPSHGYSENEIVTLTSLDLTKTLPRSTSSSGEASIENGRSYKIGVVNSDFFRLKTLTTGTPIDITTVGNAIIKLTKIVINANKDSIYAPSHNLVVGTQVKYFNNGNSSVPGLTQEANYYIYNASSDRFKLSSNAVNLSANGIDITAVGVGTHSFQTVDRDTDGNYTLIENTPYTITLRSASYIPARVIRFYPPSTINLNSSLFYLPDHRMSTGALMGYSNDIYDATTSNIAGLSIQNYYAIRIDTKHIRLATSYEDALNNNYVNVTNYGQGSNHMFLIKSLIGEVPIYNSISLSNLQNYAYSLCNVYPNLDFLQILKKGDDFTVEIKGKETINYLAASNDTVTNAVIFSHEALDNVNIRQSEYRINTGDALQYTRIGIGATSYGGGWIGLSNNVNYYVREAGAVNRYFFYTNPSDANNDINRITIYQPNTLAPSHPLTNYGGQFIRRGPNTIFTTKINYINGPYQMELSNNTLYQIASNEVHFINNTYLFPKADGYNFHRAFDGGVEMIPTRNPDTKFIRQTRRYFRYQSGKGLQCSKAVNFNAAYDIQSLTLNYKNIQNYALIKTRFPHRIKETAQIRIAGALDGGNENNNWNSSNETHYFTVAEVPSLNTIAFYYDINRLPSGSTAGGFPQYTVKNWTQSTLSAGMFDDQNGLFYQYDGQQLYAVRRNSTKQLPGFATVTFNSSQIIGNVFCKFETALSVGDYIVIRGCSYKVAYIESDTIMYVQPPYRGANNINVILTKTVDERIPQSSWSIDHCDGTGPTGYILDTTKIQMIYIDYSWYGAGKVRFGFKANNGEVRYVHEFLHNNKFNEAYLRSGNLPGRYEIANQGNPTFTPSLMHWGTSIIMDGRYDDDRAYFFTTTSKVLSYYGSNKYYGVNASGTGATSFSAVTAVSYCRIKDSRNPQSGPYYNPNTGKLERCYRLYATTTTSPGTPFTGVSDPKIIVNNGATTYTVPPVTGTPYVTETVPNTLNIKTGTILNGLAQYTSNNVFGDWDNVKVLPRTGGNFYVTGNFTRKSETSTVLSTAPVGVSTNPTLAYIFSTYSIGMSGELTYVGSSTADVDLPSSFVPLISLRLAPSVDNSKASLLGIREIVNRMQLTLAEVGILTTHDIEIQLRLNAYPSTYAWQNATPPSLCQYIAHNKGDSITGGVSIYSFRVQGGALSTLPGSTSTSSLIGRGTNSQTFDLSELATLGNSIIGGDNVYPDGPDVLTIGFVLLDTSYITVYTPFSCTGRISWKESQA